MRNKTHLWKRSMAALLCFVMILGMLPVFGMAPAAYAAEGDDTTGDTGDTTQQSGPAGNYITLPITIRDFAADGMLFEYNEVDSSDTITVGGATATGYPVYENPDDWAVNNYYSFRLYDYGEIAFDTTNSGLNWHCVICDASGNVVDVLAAGEEKQATYDSVMQSGYFSIWVWQGDHENYAVLSKVTDDNKSIYAIDFHYDSDAGTYKMYVGYRYNENVWGDGYTGINYFAAGQDPFTNNYDALWADCLICDASGNVIQVIGAGEAKEDTFNSLTSGFALFATGNDGVAQGIIRAIAGNNPTEYQATFVTDNYYGTDLLFLGNVSQSMTIHQNDTKGFGLMLTGDNDRIQDLTTTSGPGAYVSNGTYGSSTVPDPIDVTLNSGATQKGYGITIRKDLVEAELVDGNVVYTQDTVTYLANYMSQIMAEPWQNEDGSYNSFFVMGTKMFDAGETYVGPNDPNAVLDLAQILRNHVDGLGTYETTMAKLEANPDALAAAPLCETWFDAAYYLLHYTWRDNPRGDVGNDGYGMPVSQYDSLHLVEKTNADGSVYYVFNSGYNDTVYDPNNRWIYNSQTTDIDAAQLGGEDFYTRGIKLPEARFDPLGFSGTSSVGAGQWLGYGPNAGGNTYGDLTGASATQSWADFYDTTNYHLSLEGHAEFVFHYASNLYFTFTGDDDVYLFINGVRVLDLGAAHSIVKAQINLNDVAELCGLKEGEPARFDFFYLERHGTAANFGIETNIQLAQSGMITTKEGYQSGTSTGYDAPVDPAKPVAYSFTLENASDATLEHLTFTDNQLGVSLSEYAFNWGNKIEGTNVAGELVDGGPLKNMYLYIRDGNDAIVRFYSAATTPALTEDILKEELKNGLPKGYSMTIYNIRYKISDADWEAGAGTFTNTVNTNAIANSKQLTGAADWKVRKAQLVTEPFHIYNWVNKDHNDTEWQSRDVSLTKAELIQPVLDAAQKNDDTDLINKANSSADIVLCNGTGLENSALWSSDYTNIINNVTLGEDDSLIYNSKTPGMVTIYYKINNIGYPNRVYHFDVITYGAADNVYVLDYGLAVELNGNDFGLRVNDHLEVPQNIHAPNVTVTGIQDATSNYGDFVWADPSLKYTPDKIINDTDSVRVNIQILEKDAAEVTKFTGVNMYETVTTAPASVVYYEENFPGITYVNEGENQWVHYETVDENGDSVAGTEQSANQDSNYGSDPNYGAPADEETNMDDYTGGDKIGVLVSDGPVLNTINLNLDTSDLNALQASGIEALNDYFGLGGGDSNGTVNKLEVKQTADVMYFDFTGTGFELISRTTWEEYAIINVQVQKYDEETKTYAIVRQLPVITESKGGDLYQIPIISITGLEKDNYHVVIQAGTTGKVSRVFYVDGIRIYGPLDNDQALEYYNPAEYQAEFFEVKQMIENGQMFYTQLINDDINGLYFDAEFPYTMVEDDTGVGGILMPVYDLNQYMSVGPNNELYMDPNQNISVLAFALTPVEDYPNAARTLQIGAHRKADDNSWDMGPTVMTCSSDYQVIYDRMLTYWDEGSVNATNTYTVASGTEMYYTIEVDDLEIIPGTNSYLVVLAAIASESGLTNLALTNFKIAGYDISSIQPAIQNVVEQGSVDDVPVVAQPFNLLRAVRELAHKEPEVEQVPVNENLTINSATVPATKVTSGRTTTLTVKAGDEAQTVVVVDSQGNEVTPTRCVRKVVSGVATFTFVWKVTGSSGQALNYTVRVYDANGLASVNTESVTVTIR